MIHARFSLTVRDARGELTVQPRLDLAEGILVLTGPSGAGKSLTLQAIAGLLRPRDGRIVAGGETLFDASAAIDVPAHRRGIGYVPQSHALFPFLDVAGNVAFGLPRGERRDSPRVRALLEELRISHLASARPDVLSGGERQRVALARALAPSPRLLLLDEPFASIDHDGRAELRRTLRAALDRHRTPAILVTHDPADAAELGDSVVRLERGQVATELDDSIPALWRPRACGSSSSR